MKKYFINKLLFLGVLVIFFACKKSLKKKETSGPRIISLNSSITEIICALGFEDQIIGKDATSIYPPTLEKKAINLGHISQLSIEGILSLNPSWIMAQSEELNRFRPEIKNQLEKSGIKIFSFPIDYSIKGAKILISQLAELFQVKEKASELQKWIDQPLKTLKKIEKKPKVLFLYSRDPSHLLAAGKNTPIEKIISLAGGENAIQNFENYKPLNTEGLLKLNPDVILVFDNFLQAMGGKESLLKIPGINHTKAGKNKFIIGIKAGLINNIGPRIGEAVRTLNEEFSKIKL